MELKETQWKLLSHIYHTGRESITAIAKATKLTRIQVEYNLDKLKKEGVVKKYLTMFNYRALGYNNYVFLLVKLEKFSSFKDFTKVLDNSKNCISWGECFGRYDIFTNLIFKNEKDITKFISNLNNNKNTPLLDYLLIKPYLTEFYHLKLFEHKEKNIFPFTFPDGKKEKLDKNEIKMLKLLENDGQMKVIDIAHNLDISAELALYKLRKLYMKKIILGTRLQLDMKKLEYNYSGFFMHIKNLSETTISKLKNFARNHRLVNALVLSLMKPNCFMQVFHKTEDELKETIREIKILLKDELFELEILLLDAEDKVNTLPFFK